MRLMVTFSFPASSGNEVVSSGKIAQVFKNLMEDLKPEAAYFYPEGGQRGGVLFVNIENNAAVMKCAEPLWLALQADVKITPVMSGEDLQNGLGDIAAMASRYS